MSVNEAILNSVVRIYKRFVSEVEAKDVVDLLIQKSVIDKRSKEKITRELTKQDRCQALLNQLFLSSHDETFIVLREALEYKYPAIVECIDEIETNYPKARERGRVQRRLSIGADGAVYDLADDSSFETSTPMKTADESPMLCFNCVKLEKEMNVKFEAVERRLQRLESELKETGKEKHDLTDRCPRLQNPTERAPATDGQTLETNAVHRRRPTVNQPSVDNTLYENINQNTRRGGGAVRRGKLTVAQTTRPFADRKLYENVNLNTEKQHDENPTKHSSDTNFHWSSASVIRSSHPSLPPKPNTTVHARKSSITIQSNATESAEKSTSRR